MIHQAGGELPEPISKSLNQVEVQATQVSARVCLTCDVLRADDPQANGKTVNKKGDTVLGSSDVRVNGHARVDHLNDKARPVAGFNCFCMHVIAIGNVFARTKTRSDLN